MMNQHNNHRDDDGSCYSDGRFYSIEDHDAPASPKKRGDIIYGRRVDSIAIGEPEVLEGIRLRGHYSCKQAASLLGISKSSFQRIRKEGKIKSRMSDVSRRPYYLGRDLLRLMNLI